MKATADFKRIERLLKAKAGDSKLSLFVLKFLIWFLKIHALPTEATGDRHHGVTNYLYPQYRSFKRHPWNRIILTRYDHYLAHLMIAVMFWDKPVLAMGLGSALIIRHASTGSKFDRHREWIIINGRRFTAQKMARKKRWNINALRSWCYKNKIKLKNGNTSQFDKYSEYIIRNAPIMGLTEMARANGWTRNALKSWSNHRKIKFVDKRHQPRPSELNNISDWIRRNSSKMSVAEMARKKGVSDSVLRRWGVKHEIIFRNGHESRLDKLKGYISSNSLKISIPFMAKELGVPKSLLWEWARKNNIKFIDGHTYRAAQAAKKKEKK